MTETEERIENALDPETVGWLRKDPGVWLSFAKLVEKRCNPRELWDYLAPIAIAWGIEDPQRKDIRPRFPLPPNTFEDLIGFNRDELPTVIKRLMQCAADLGRL